MRPRVTCWPPPWAATMPNDRRPGSSGVSVASVSINFGATTRWSCFRPGRSGMRALSRSSRKAGPGKLGGRRRLPDRRSLMHGFDDTLDRAEPQRLAVGAGRGRRDRDGVAVLEEAAAQSAARARPWLWVTCLLYT